MTGLGEEVYTGPDHFSDVSKMVEEAAKAIYDREYIRDMNERFYAKELAICANKARAAWWGISYMQRSAPLSLYGWEAFTEYNWRVEE